MFIYKSVDYMLFGERCHLEMTMSNDFVKVKINRNKPSYSLNSPS